jgi:non-specific serine/threonine protein kinase/serine/threonine-protein kinase
MIGQTVSHFKILDALGEGGMGVVYKAQDLKLDRLVALKFLPPSLTSDDEAKRRFVYEAKAASALDHPNICTIYEIDELPDGRMFMAMAYYDGESLRERLEEGALDIEEATLITGQVAMGLTSAHEKGIVHRDIKPANIVISGDGQIKILDFGLAKLADRTKITKTGSTLGTVAYMSPEQIQGIELDARSDVFSLGVVLYEMIAGERPYDGDHSAAMIYRILNEDPVPLNEIVPDLPESITELVNHALEKDREDRLQSVEEFISALGGTAAPLMAPRKSGQTTRSRRVPGHAPNDEIGPYRLRDRVGVGGMGEVWSAEQQKPFRRKVALKIVKAGMDSTEIVARFEAERQALALMDHPCIAKVYDAGATPIGRPYFAMEFVPGLPITEYCDQHKLNTRERLKLFIRLCDGVQHAHQKAVIHRDLKPSNVLVTEVDDEAMPKVIDFGVAKATAQPLTEKTMFTQMGQLIGTPEYMSPEQADLSGEDIDTRADIYSLGVILYEMISGELPFDSEELRAAGFDGIRRKIREEDPPTPSRRITTLNDSKSTAASRRTDPKALSKQLRGEVDWIIMKAIDKDRARRYASASDLAADIQRYLRNEPVQAGPPSVTYRFKKFVIRHRVGVVAASLVIFAMMLGIAGTTIGLFRAINAERVAREEAEAASQVSQFLEGLFAVSDPGEARGNSVTAREILDRGAEKITTELEDQPVVEARLLVTMGRVYRRLGLYDEASALLERALELRIGVLGDESVEVAEADLELAWLLSKTGDYTAAQRLYEQALEIQESTHGSESPEVAKTMSSIANVHKRARRYDEARALHERALAIREKTLGPNHTEVSNSLNLLGNLHIVMGEHKSAVPLYKRALTIREKNLGQNHPRVGVVLGNLANVYWQMGDFDRAREYNGRALDIQEKVLGPEHPDLAFALTNTANLLAASGDYAAARDVHERALAIRKNRLRPDHPDLADTLYNLACVSALQGDRDEAYLFLRESMDRGFARPVIFNDSDLTLLQEDAEFEAILGVMKERLGSSP